MRIEHLADHAQALGDAINRFLCLWSPWHLRHQLFAEIADHLNAVRDLGISEQRRRELVEYHRRPMESLARSMRPTIEASVAHHDFSGETIFTFRPEVWRYVADPDLVRAMAVYDLRDHTERMLAQAMKTEAGRAIEQMLEQAARRPQRTANR